MRNLLTALLGLTLFLSTGCESPGYKPPSTSDGLSEEAWKQKIEMSQAAWQMLQVVNVKEGVQNGLLRVQVDFKNRTQGPQSFRVLFDWFDADGFKLDSPNDGWKSHMINAAQEFTAGATATSPKAKSWRLSVNNWGRK